MAGSAAAVVAVAGSGKWLVVCECTIMVGGRPPVGPGSWQRWWAGCEVASMVAAVGGAVVTVVGRAVLIAGAGDCSAVNAAAVAVMSAVAAVVAGG